MASNINSLCKALGKPNQYKLLNVPLRKLVPEERIGVVGTGGRTESEICNEIKYNIRKKAESSARRATGPLNDKGATANIGGKEVKVKVKVAQVGIDEEKIEIDYEAEIARLGLSPEPEKGTVEHEMLQDANHSARRVLHEVLSTENYAKKLFGGVTAVPFSDDLQDLEHLEFFKMLMTNSKNVLTSEFQYNLEKQTDKKDFDLKWRIAALREATKKTTDGEECVIKHKTSEMLMKEYKRVKQNSEVVATPGPLKILQKEQKSYVSKFTIVPKPAVRSAYVEKNEDDESDFPVSSSTTLNKDLVIGTATASNDPTAPYKIEKDAPQNNIVKTPYRKMICGACGDRRDRTITTNRRGVLHGRDHSKCGFSWFNSNCTYPCRRCGNRHDGQGLFCQLPITKEEQLLFDTTIANTQGESEVDRELFNEWIEIEKKEADRRLNKKTRQKGGISQKKTTQLTSKRKRALSLGGNLPPPAPS